MKKIKQFIFYGPGRENNYPKDTADSNNPWLYNLFENYKSVSHLGIQGHSDIRFYLNAANKDGSHNAGEAITLGATGIYEINLEGVGTLSYLKFDWDELTRIYSNSELIEGKKLIIDFVYEGEN